MLKSCVTMDQSSDHSAISFQLPFPKPKSSIQKISFRNLKNIDPQQFSNDIETSDLYRNPENTTEGLVEQYNRVLSSLYDKHAPEKTKTRSICMLFQNTCLIN